VSTPSPSLHHHHLRYITITFATSPSSPYYFLKLKMGIRGVGCSKGRYQIASNSPMKKVMAFYTFGPLALSMPDLFIFY
jgi:hypothetical protein